MRVIGLSVMMALGLAGIVAAQAVPLDCNAPENASNEECLGLPPAQEATNFVPAIAPVLGGLAALAGLVASAGGGSNSTNTTTSTTSTVPN